MSLSKRRNSSVLLLACLLAATPALAQQGDPNAGILSQPAPEAMPRTSAECTAYAIQRSNEEYMAQDSSVRRNSPFQTGPAAPAIRSPTASDSSSTSTAQPGSSSSTMPAWRT